MRPKTNKHKVISYKVITARTDDAIRWGLLPALVMQHITYWAKKNEKRGINVDKRHRRGYTCITNRRLQQIFRYASYSSVRRALETLHREGMIHKEIWKNPALPGGKCLALAPTRKYFELERTPKKPVKSAQPEHDFFS